MIVTIRLKPAIIFGCTVGVILLLFLWMSSHSRYTYVDASCENSVESQGAICEEAEADMWVDFLQVTLCSDHADGFEWQLTDVTGQLRVEVLSREYFSPSTDESEELDGTEVWTFTLGLTGNVTISMEYSQPWEGGTRAARTFDLSLNRE
ncbi:MAG TPA: protease inhibitor I42 family protein [Dehalococcoidia bacterium]|nr:protease inhibitor I42 family protein [Dehalococcoidia bacterium]